MPMRVARILTVAILLALWGALPALACLLPQRALTPSEMKCCAHMAGNCGGKMQTSHSCCKPVANQGVAALTAARQAQSLALAALTAALFESKQASALPDTNVMVQHLSVGSPRPFAGYTNSEFAYIGLGASQDLPFPGKRKLRGEVAGRGSETTRLSAEVIRQDAIQRLTIDYIQLSYLQRTLALLEENNRSLGDIEKIVESRYRVGQGNQQEILKAQLQHTRILNEITMHHREVGELQAEIKALLNRPQQSEDILTEPVTATVIEALPATSQSI